MKRNLLRMIGLILVVATLPLYAQSHKAKKVDGGDATIPNGAVHIRLISVDEGNNILLTARRSRFRKYHSRRMVCIASRSTKRAKSPR
jgi:hypothetical protein